MKSVSFIDTVVVQNDYSFCTIQLRMRSFQVTYFAHVTNYKLMFVCVYVCSNTCVFVCMSEGLVNSRHISVWTNKVYLILN